MFQKANSTIGRESLGEKSLIKVGTLAVTGQAQFIEIKPSTTELRSNNQSTCAILRSNGNDIEVLNGADPNTLEAVLNLIVRLWK